MNQTVVAVDVGGTFTDIVISADGKITGFYKVPTTPRNPETGILDGLKKYCNTEISEFLHATTIATNSLLGQHGLEIEPVALITTKGFRDIIEIGRQNRPKLYDLLFERPKVLVTKENRYEIDERVDVDGNILKNIDLEELRKPLEEIRKRNIRSVAVAFLHSYANPDNELKIGRELQKVIEYVSLSSTVAPEPREYERTSTATVNAALMPVTSGYIRKLDNSMKNFGSPSLSIMASSGGLISAEEATTRPVQIVESGPAAGVIAASEFSKLIGLKNVISFDMGGTTAKAGTIRNFEVEITSEYEVGGQSHHGRMTKGSGYPVRFPFVDLAEVSAGGGTIIWKDAAGALKIGPLSAGADPGPVSYGKGGTEPTITDANLVTGIIRDSMLGSEMKLDKESAKDALSKLGEPFGIAGEALRLVDLEMARAIRIVTVERGIDPLDFSIMAFGGAGPQHAARIAEEIGVDHVIIPPEPGVFSALGLMFSDWKYESRISYPRDLQESFGKLEKKMREKFPHAEFLYYADCRYSGQGSELTIPVGSTDVKLKELQDAFEEAHMKAFGFKLERKVDVVTIRIFAVIKRTSPKIVSSEHSDSAGDNRTILEGGKWIEARTITRHSLKPGSKITGPALIDEYGSTTYVPSGWEASPGNNLEIHLRRVR